jgi:hypothetical protein
MAVVVEGVSMSDLSVDATDRQIHLRQTPSRVVRFLTVNGDVTELAAVRLDKLLAADNNEHKTKAAPQTPEVSVLCAMSRIVAQTFVNGNHNAIAGLATPSERR